VTVAKPTQKAKPSSFEKGATSLSWTCSEAFRTLPAWAFLFVGLVDGIIGGGTTFHRLDMLSGAEHDGKEGMPFDVAAWVNSPNAIMNIIAVFCVGLLLDRGVEPPRLLIVSMCANLGSILFIASYHPVTELQGLAHGLFQGVNWGVSLTVKTAAYASYFGRDYIGTILGVEKFVNIAGTAIGPVALASLRNLMGSFAGALRVVAVLPCLAVVLLCFARRPKRPGYGSESKGKDLEPIKDRE